MTKAQVLIPLILLLAILAFIPRVNQTTTPNTEPLQIDEKWFITWGGSAYESPRRIIYDGSCLYIYGRTLSYCDGEFPIFLAKYHMEGGLEWDTVYETPTLDVPQGYTLEGSHIYLTGTTYRGEGPSADLDVMLLKVDRESGELIWNASWGGAGFEGEPGLDYGKDVEILGDSIYVAGITTSDAANRNEQDILLLRFDEGGELIWQR